MSKLDEIILNIPGAVLHTDKDGYKTVHRKAVVAKRDIKDLFKELIGEDLEIPTGPRAAGKTYAHVANTIKEELRQKVDQL